MEPLDPLPEEEPGLFSRIRNILGGVDWHLLKICPERDESNVNAICLLLCAVFVYQSIIYSLVAQILFAADGRLHPELVAGAMFISLLIMMIDSYFIRAGHYTDGIRDLAKAGLDLSGGFTHLLRGMAFLLVRVGFGVCLSQLAGLFVALIIFNPSISANNTHLYQIENARVIALATAHKDADINRITAEKADADAHLAALKQQAISMRNSVVDPGSANSAVQSAQHEVDELVAEKAASDKSVEEATIFAADERGGVKGTSANSGHPGRGPVAIAAEQRAAAAAANNASIAKALDVARERLDTLRKQMADSDQARAQQAQSQVPQIQADIQSETARVDALGHQLNDMTGGRDAAIQAEVDNSPDTIPLDSGLVGQIKALGRLAQDPEIEFVIILIGLASCGLEMAALFCKVFSYAPTTYSAMLVKEIYLDHVKIAEEIDGVLQRRMPPEAEAEAEDLTPIVPNNDGGSGGAEAEPGEPFISMTTPLSFVRDDDALSEKRPRGRPRKDPVH